MQRQGKCSNCGKHAWVDELAQLCRRCEIKEGKLDSGTTKAESANLDGPTVTQGDSVRD